MTIDEIKGCTHAGQPCTRKQESGGKKFEQILNHAMDSIVRKEGAGDAVSPVRGIELPPLWEHGHLDDSVLKRAYDVLDLLEEYSQALNNPDVSLKGIEPIVTRMQQEVRGLDSQLGDNVAKSDELFSIINKIAVTAKVEAFKFQRGDYIG